MNKRQWYSRAFAVVAFTIFFAPELGMTLSGAMGIGFLITSAVICGLFAAGVGAVVHFVYRWKSALVEYKPTPTFYKGFGIPTGAYAALIVVVCFFAGRQSTEDAERRAIAKKQIAEQQARAASAAAEKARIAAMSPEERQAHDETETINSGKEMVRVETAGSDHVQTRPPAWEEMRKKLTEIGISSQRHDAAQAVLASMDADDKHLAELKVKEAAEAKQREADAKKAEAEQKKQAAALAKSLEPMQIAARKEFAAKLEQQFLEKRMDTTVTANGPKSTNLSIKWVLASRVTANDLTKSPLMDEARELGFKTVHFFNGFESSLAEDWSWKL